MKKNLFLRVVVVSLVAVAATVAPGVPGSGRARAASAGSQGALGGGESTGYVPEEIIVELSESHSMQVRGRLDARSRVRDARTGIPSLDSLGWRFGVREMRPLLSGVHPQAFPRVRSRLPNFFLIRLGSGRDALQALEEYRKEGAVKTAQLNYLYTADKVPNDTLYSRQWAHQNTSAEAGWDLATGVAKGGAPRILIAILGQGTQLTHEDLAANIVPGYDTYSEDNDPSPGPGEDHETAVSGTAAAVTNNRKGVAGVCWGCGIMPLRVGPDPYPTEDVTQAINYAANHGAHVINMSFSSTLPGKFGPDTSVMEAVENAFASGVVLVGSAGNSNNNIKRYPGAYDNVIAVGSTTILDTRSSFSNFGDYVDVAAPGTQIQTTTFGAGVDCYLQTSLPNYACVNGTSFSAPYVAGLAALLISKTPTLTPADVRLRIEYSADKIDPDHYIGAGRVNVQRALSLTANPTLFATIKSPDRSSFVDPAPLAVFGTALGTSYVLEYKPRSGSAWTELGSGSQVINGNLGALDTTVLPSGFYDIRLTSFSGASQDQDQVEVFVAGNPPAQAGWPRTAASAFYSSPVYADLDADGRQEIVAGAANGQIYVWRHDGSPLPGWPSEALGLNAMLTTPAVGDVDGNGDLEIVVIEINSPNLRVWNHDGTLYPGYPRNTGVPRNPGGSDYFRGSVTLVNLDADPALEIILPNIEGVVKVWNVDGTDVPGWPQQVDTNLQSTASVGDVNADGEVEVIVRQWEKIYAFRRDGTLLTGWPLFLSPGHTPPVLGNLGGDGALEIVDSDGYSIFALNEAGAVTFYTRLVDGSISNNLSLGDLEGDGALEIFMGSDSGPVYGLDSQGLQLSGWPVSPAGRVGGPPLVVDIDADGQKEVITGADDGRLYAWRKDGSLAMVTLNLGSPISDGPMAGDIDADGDLELIAVAGNTVHVFDLAGAATLASVEWPMFQSDAQHTGSYRFGQGSLDFDGDGDPNSTDCAPFNPAIHHGALEICNNLDDDCDGALSPAELDADGDGVTPCQGDCDDTRASVKPGATEICNDLDDNCDGRVDEGFADEDLDGLAACAGDCNDRNPLIPGAENYIQSPISCFDALDNDCDGVADYDCAVDIGDQRVPSGTVSGGLANIRANSADDVYESIKESNSGKRLIAYWTFLNVSPSIWYDLRVEGFRSSSTGDSFNMSWTTKPMASGMCDGTESYQPALTVVKTVDDDLQQIFRLGPPPAGQGEMSFCIRTVDSNPASSDKNADTLRLDKVYVFPIPLDARALGESTTVGTRLNGTSYLQTQSLDGVAETMEEAGADALDHTWRFSAPIGSGHTLYIDAWRTNDADYDDFQFYYATPVPNVYPEQPGAFQIINGALVNQARGGVTLNVPFGPSNLVGTVWIKVKDTVPNGAQFARLAVDYLAIKTTP